MKIWNGELLENGSSIISKYLYDGISVMKLYPIFVLGGFNNGEIKQLVHNTPSSLKQTNKKKTYVISNAKQGYGN